ncbi:MAG: hypothetical protein V3W19_08695 [Desulfatiglandales bacterium]
MKRLTLAVLIFFIASGAAYGERKRAADFTFEAAQKQAYWYSLNNVAHLTMFSGMGKIMKGGGMTGIIEWLKGGGVKKAELVKDMYMISSVYAEGDPHFIQAVDLDNKRSMGWDRQKMDKTLNPSAQAFTIIKSVTKNFHRDYHETKDNQRIAIAMYPEAKEMAKLLVEKMIDDRGLFVTLSPDGKEVKPNPFDQVAVLWAFSDLALISSDPEVPPYNDVDLARWSSKMADKAFNATKRLPPESIIDKAIAIEALGRYGAAIDDKVLRREAIRLILRYAEALRKGSKKTITEMGLSVYGLIEAFRVTGSPGFMKEALRIFNKDMESLWDKKAGIYANFKGSKRHVYTPFDVGAVLAALNSIAWFVVPPYDDPLDSGPDLAKKRYVKFFENALVISGLQRASGISLVERRYLDREARNHFAHPSLPQPEEGGGSFGIAPVYASEVSFEDGKWAVTNERFNTKEAMFLATMSVILNRHQVDSFIPVQRLMAKLLADVGI